MTSAQSRLHDWADVILADFQTVKSHYLHNISTIFLYAAERMLRTIIMQIFRLIQAFFLAKSSRFKSADFASVMTDDVGCSGRHQCPQCDRVPDESVIFRCKPKGLVTQFGLCWLRMWHGLRTSLFRQTDPFVTNKMVNDSGMYLIDL